ncbi:hypothetical protein BDY24DRAFT_403275 [Mrakia frigida]|uniref:uncharacterized protein n=1 Tax=Mrakia frigida TaxID=29902 RepID=UPI003FCC1C5D
MSAIFTSEALRHKDRLRGQTVVITGAGSGIGRQVSLLFASFGAKMVMGDRDLKGVEKVAKEITAAGGEAVFASCDVTQWDDQVKLFELARNKFGSIDVVLPNAGITEFSTFDVQVSFSGTLSPPDFRTLDINLTGAIYTSLLALHHFAQPPSSSTHKSLKSLVITGSMASFFGANPTAVLYSVSKAGKLGLMNGLRERCNAEGVRLGLICPWFVKTPLVGDLVVDEKIGWAKIEDVALAFLHASTDPDIRTSGSAYTIPDSKGILRMSPKELVPKGFGGLHKKVRAEAKL